jgi:hypothetical protein
MSLLVGGFPGEGSKLSTLRLEWIIYSSPAAYAHSSLPA